MNEITILYFVIGFLGAHVAYLTVKLYGYRKAIIQLQKDVGEPGGILDELTRPAPKMRQVK